MQTVVGVLRGGLSQEHEVSLKSGQSILTNLSPEKFTARDIYIDKQGNWHDRGKATKPDRVLASIDVALLPLHGEFGENGELQRLLERFGVPYMGANSFGSFLAMHKLLAKKHAQDAGLKTPAYRFVETESDIEGIVSDAIRSFHQPMVVKPVAWGSSVGVSIVGGYAPALGAVKKLFSEGAQGVLIEERIRGREATVGVVENLRGEALYALPVVEIIPPANDFFSYDAKYSGKTREIVPGNFSRVVAEELARAAKVMHRELGQRHFSRSDFIVAEDGVYFLETNSAAAVGLTSESLLPKSLAAVGVSFSDFLSHLIGLALS